MEYLIWGGAVFSVLGIAGLLACAVLMMKAKGAGLGDAELRERLRGIVALNLGALFVSAIGLMLVVLGITFR